MKENSLRFLEALIRDFSRKCSTTLESKDLATISSRFRYEGSSFLTITLPQFSEDFFLGLERGEITSDLFRGWKKRRHLPAFLQGFVSLVFDSYTGELLNEPLVEAVHAIRQIANFFKKVSLPCTNKRISKAIRGYVQTDCSLGTLLSSINSDDLELFEKVGRVFISHVFGEEVDESLLLPHHGPGSTAEGVKGNEKYKPQNFCWYSSLDSFFQPSDLYSSEECYHEACVPEMKISNLESTVKVITVPKTLKTPRVIAMEPTAIQFAQQSLKDYFVDRIERNTLTKGHICFKDQCVNQKLALSSSIDKGLATLDLSEASDRVHKELVWKMFSVNPKLRDLIFCCRSPRARVDGSELILNKFASMGSALCFPVEALFFMTCLLTGYHKHRDLQPSLATIRKAIKRYYVYGDDIIIPTDQVESLVTALSTYGNVVGSKKSFSKGFFRESCGVDAFKGVEITPVYVRQLLPKKLSQAKRVVSSVSTANQLFKKGLSRTALLMKEQVELVTGRLPVIAETSPGLGWWLDVDGKPSKKRYNHKLHRYEVLTYVPFPVLKQDRIEGYNALTKCLLNLERKSRNEISKTDFTWDNYGLSKTAIAHLAQASDKKHLVETSVRGALTLKRRWTQAH